MNDSEFERILQAKVDYDKKKTNRQNNWNSYAIKFELEIKIL